MALRSKNTDRLLSQEWRCNKVVPQNVKITTTNNTLLQKMLLEIPGTAADLERIHVKTGLWLAEPSQHTDWAYFPDNSLVSLSAVRPALDRVTMAVVGHRGFWFSNMFAGTPLQAQVLQAGDLYRLDWRRLQNDPQRFAPWLVSTAEASQRLIRQMSQMAFCASHHTPVERLASWMLVCLQEMGPTSRPLCLDDLPDDLRAHEEAFQAAGGALATMGAGADRVGLSLLDNDGMPPKAWSLDPASLKPLACACHHRIHGQASV